MNFLNSQALSGPGIPEFYKNNLGNLLTQVQTYTICLIICNSLTFPYQGSLKTRVWNICINKEIDLEKTFHKFSKKMKTLSQSYK